MEKIENKTQLVFKPKPRIWNFKDIEGQRFGRLYAVGYLGRSLSGRTMWLVHCDCGTYIKISVEELRTGKPHSCGCANDSGLSN
jgi:aminopeptidase C